MPRLSCFAVILVGVCLAPRALAWTHVDYQIPTPNSAAVGIAFGADGNVWFTEYASKKIARLQPDGRFTEFDVPQGSPLGIGAGPDGNIWFGIYSATYQYGRITPSGSITAFSLSMPFASMFRIAPGPDGRVWATLFCDDAVFRIDPADGSFTRFPVPTAGGCPYGITGGPDGNVWFTEHYRNKIGRITPAGIVTEFRIGPVDARNPDDIVTGPDGALWATDNWGVLHRITTDGQLTEVSIANGNFSPIAADSAALWVGANGTISRVLTNGTQHIIPLPDTDHTPVSITLTPDGSVWFVEAYTNAIGRILPGSGLMPVAPCRLSDTRTPGSPRLTPPQTLAFYVTGGPLPCGIPPGVAALALNVTVTNATADGYVVLYSSDLGAPPFTSTLNYRQGQTRANNAIVPVGGDGYIVAYSGQSSGTVDLILDVVGYFP